MADDECCAICHDALDTAHAHTLSCGHTYHADCLITWLRRGGLNCPLCRTDLSEHVPGVCLAARAKIVRAHARRKNAPRDLQLQVDVLRRTEEAERSARRDMAELRRAHREVFHTEAALRRKRWMAARRKWRLTRLLGIYENTALRLPPLVVVSHLHE